MRCPKYWSFSFSFSISPSNEHPGLISFRMDWLDLLAVQWTLKSLLQHYSSKASILRCLASFMDQLSHLYMTTGKTRALAIQTFFWQSDYSTFSYTVLVCHSFSCKEQVSFNFIATIAVSSDFGAQEDKICHCFHFSPFSLP